MTHDQYSNLSNDIILMIIDFIHPGDLENFASVSQRNYNLSSKALAVHRARKKAFGVVNDTHPLTIPNLLASVISEPSLAIVHQKACYFKPHGSSGMGSDSISTFRFQLRKKAVACSLCC